MKIVKDSVVSLLYTLTYDNAQGELIEQIEKENPFVGLVGHADMLQKFEEQIMGKEIGNKFSVTVKPEDAFGEYDEEAVREVSVSELVDEVGIENDEIFEGNVLSLVDEEDDEEFSALIVEVSNDTVTLDLNHPLAGETIHFEGEILNIRQATADEISAGSVTSF